ncbi:MAG: 2-oxoacid:acceptor oxidoreductase family protein [Lentisphaerae bacterium]|nr:2-oxoacid:acceptor oxidoreductase family protein [Lentisphaerota bacterium]
MLERLLVAGSGGQGILLAGKLLAGVAVDDVPHITFFPSYGAEVREGTSNCQVTFSSSPIASPLSQVLDSMIVMNQASLETFLPRLAHGGLLMLNRSLCVPPPGASAVALDATEMADRLGNTRAANMVMLGAYLARKPVVSADRAEDGVRRILSAKNPKLVDVNIEAFRLGLKS